MNTVVRWSCFLSSYPNIIRQTLGVKLKYLIRKYFFKKNEKILFFLIFLLFYTISFAQPAPGQTKNPSDYPVPLVSASSSSIPGSSSQPQPTCPGNAHPDKSGNLNPGINSSSSSSSSTCPPSALQLPVSDGNSVKRQRSTAIELKAQKIKPSPTSETIRYYSYTPGHVYAVHAGLGIATQIVLDPSEKVRDFGTGFSSGWDIVRRDNVFFLKPKDPDAETNMYIRTDRRSYLFDLKIVSKDWIKIDEARAQGVSYIVQFTYPDIRPEIVNVKPVDSSPLSSPYLSFYTDYEAASEDSAKWLRPIRVFDDGKVTYVQMPPMTQTPAFFGRLTDRGEEFLVNRSMDKGRHVLHGVYPFIIIRYGTDVVAIRRR